jgi:hypothetical protein
VTVGRSRRSYGAASKDLIDRARADPKLSRNLSDRQITIPKGDDGSTNGFIQIRRAPKSCAVTLGTFEASPHSLANQLSLVFR